MPAIPGANEAEPLLISPGVFKPLEGIVAGFTTRTGGVSRAPFTSLNLGLSTGDAAGDVETNRARVAARLGFSPGALAIAGQVHGDAILKVDAPGLYPGYDGMVTTATDLLLGISAADCAAVLLADAEQGVIGACHSGWRGTVARIAAKTVEEMRALGARPENIRAFIGPCISADAFEVGEEVAAAFDDRYVVRRADWPRPHVDLKAAIRDQLHEAGIAPAHAEVSAHCTFSDTGLFFSYRAEDGQTGRMMGLIGRQS